jgi:hypothetical protein
MATTTSKEKEEKDESKMKSEANSLLYTEVSEGRVPPDANGPWKMNSAKRQLAVEEKQRNILLLMLLCSTPFVFEVHSGPKRTSF